MSDIKWINLNPFGSHSSRHKAKEKKCEDLEERTVGGKTISRPISMCPQCEVLHFSIVCTSCGYRNGPNDQESHDSDVSPRTMTIAQQSQDRLEDRRTHTPVAPSSVYPSDSVSNRIPDYTLNSGINIRGQSEFCAHGYGRRRPSDTRVSEVPGASRPTPVPRVQPGKGYSSFGIEVIPIGYNGFPGDYSPRGTPPPTPPPTLTKPLSPLRSLRLVEEHELQNMSVIDLEADGAQRPWTESSKSRSSCCKNFRGNMRRDWLGCMIVGGVILAGMITLGVLAVL
jgi:hypothetical protein